MDRQLTPHGLHNRPFDDDLSDTLAGVVPAQYVPLNVALSEFQTAVDAAQRSPELSDAGRRAAIERAVATAAAAIRAVAKHPSWSPEAHRADAEQYRAMILGKAQALPEGVDAAALREEREGLYTLSRAEVFGLAERAARENTPAARATLAAIRSAPATRRLLDERQQQAIDELQLATYEPRALPTIEQRQRLAECLDDNVAIARRTIAGNGRLGPASVLGSDRSRGSLVSA